MLLQPLRKSYTSRHSRNAKYIAFFKDRIMTTLRSFIFLVIALFVVGAAIASPAVNDPAPNFELPDQTGKMHTLDQYKGKWVVLYFYPKDNTPGCTTQACELRDNIFAFRRLNAEILGISFDDVDSHKEFAEEYNLPFALLADTDGEMIDAYGVRGGMGLMDIAKRQTFIISPDGRIARHYEKVDVDTHSDDVLADLEQLGKES